MKVEPPCTQLRRVRCGKALDGSCTAPRTRARRFDPHDEVGCPEECGGAGLTAHGGYRTTIRTRDQGERVPLATVRARPAQEPDGSNASHPSSQWSGPGRTRAQRLQGVWRRRPSGQSAGGQRGPPALCSVAASAAQRKYDSGIATAAMVVCADGMSRYGLEIGVRARDSDDLDAPGRWSIQHVPA